MPITIEDPTSLWLIAATWIAAVAALVTAGILACTLRAAWANLDEFKKSERVRRTADLFFDFYTKEYLEENQHIGAPPLKQTPYMAIGSVIKAPKLVKAEVLMIVHNYFEAVAALHWKDLIDSELYFDSFARVIIDVYQPLTERLAAVGSRLTPYSRIPQLYADAQAYLDKRTGG
jgi:hypothetical protein